MPEYTIVIKTTEEESIASLADMVNDIVDEYPAMDRVNPDYLPIDESRDSPIIEGIAISISRTE